jgi:RNA polymerase sigma factor for flagellar operon FliA
MRGVNNEKQLDQIWHRFLKEKSAQLREELAKSYFYLVQVESRRLSARLPFQVFREKKDDLFSAGMVGLLQALDHFKIPKVYESVGRAFEVYARFRIRGQMVDELRTLDFAKRNLRKQARIIWEAEEALYQILGRTPTAEEVTNKIGIPVEEFYNCLAEINMLNLLSLDAQNVETEKFGLNHEKLPDTKTVSAVDQLEQKERLEIIKNLIKALGDAEQKVLQLYYLETLTFKEIGQVLKLTESRVCQIHHTAIFRIQSMIERGNYYGSAQRYERVHHHYNRE